MDHNERDAYFQVTVDPSVTPTAVLASGELDAASSGELDQAIGTALEAGRGVSLDLSQLTFIDSSGVRVLTVAVHRARNEDQDFLLAASSQAVQRIFDLTGVGALFSS